MDLGPLEKYRSASQLARVLTETWVTENGFCPACLAPLKQAPNNSPALDFTCRECPERFELKSRKGAFGSIVPDGAYASMMEAIRRDEHPNLFLLRYSMPFGVSELRVIPKRFIVEPMVLRRRPLSDTARRAGWVGCNLDIGLIPKIAFVNYVSEGIHLPMESVTESWKQTAVLDDVRPSNRGWLAVTLGYIERLGKREFALSDLYAHEAALQRLFPKNLNVRAKLRQQLQLLRDLRLIDFLGGGKYVALFES